MERRASARVGELRPPPMLLRADGHYHVIHAVLGRLSVVERCETLEEGVLRWSAYFLRVCDGMFAPRVTCKHLLEKITGQQQRLEDELDLEVRPARPPARALAAAEPRSPPTPACRMR